MIDLHYAPTSNGLRAALGLSEAGLAFTPHLLDLAAGGTRTPQFLQLNPAGTAPVMVDDAPAGGGAPLVLAQSGAILLYAARKSGRLLPDDSASQARAWQWMMFACSDCAGASTGIGMAAKLGTAAPEAAALYEKRLQDLMAVADGGLAGGEWLAGSAISVADVALYPIYSFRKAQILKAPRALPNLERWAQRMAARPAVAAVMDAKR